jgi:SAM-dependent methyltransferase
MSWFRRPEPGRAEAAALRRKLARLEELRKQQKGEAKRFAQTAEIQDREIAALEQVVGRLMAERGALPLPPPELRENVGRNVGVGNFLSQGLGSARRVLDVFGHDPGGPVLDWGCGSGRTLTWLRGSGSWTRHYRGCDVDEAAIAWLRRNGVAAVEVCADLPPLPYPDATFRGLFAFSVLTHIPPPDHAAWHAEIARVLKPGGRAYLTMHSDASMGATQSLSDEERGRYADQGWCWSERAGHYKHAALVRKDFTLAALPPTLELERYEPAGYHTMDVLIVRKAP